MDKNLAEKYPYIVWWGKSLGSFDYYIEAQLKLAEQTNAPVTATYRQQDGTWATIEGITNPNTRDQLVRWCKRVGRPVPVWDE